MDDPKTESNDSRDDDKPTGSSITCDHAKGTEEGMPQPVDPEVCTDLHVTEDHDPSNDATLQETEMQSLNTELETKEEPLRETTPLTTAQQDATTLMDQEMETSHVPDSLLDISNTPIMVAHATTDFIGQKSNNFLKGCKWAPDGSCLLTCSDDNLLRIFNLPASLYSSVNQCCDEELQSVRWIKEGETIYDYCWYPLMTSFDAATCCFASTSKESPVHLWDGFNDSLRCSYSPYNHLDELVAAYSLGFTRDGSQLLCGFPKSIRVFPTASPGKQCQVISTSDTKSKLGQTGIISCFAFHPTHADVFAAGAYSGSVGVYSLSSGELQFLMDGGHSGGITHLVFSVSGNYLYSGGRKDPTIVCWDVRNPGKVLMKMRRSVETNQRMYFDLDSIDQYLVSGNHSGSVSVWDTRQCANEEDAYILNNSLSFQAHNDCVNGVSLHPTLPLLATSSGQRKFPLRTLLDYSSDEEDSDGNGSDNTQENCLKLWSLSSQPYSLTTEQTNCT